MLLRIPNRTARHLWLQANGLSSTPTGLLDLPGIIGDLGFVQLDTVRVIARAHHHILWTRNQSYREPMLWDLLAKDRAVFEHFTHDAALLPIGVYPLWQRQFRRLGALFQKGSWGTAIPPASIRDTYKARITAEGPLSTKDFETKDHKRTQKAWSRPPHKVALDYMWYVGELTTSHRKNFVKYYDLTERVIPAPLRERQIGETAAIAQLCHMALHRLNLASAGDIKRFWDAVSPSDVQNWLSTTPAPAVPVEMETADGSWQTCWSPPDIEHRLETLTPPSRRLRVINPFDPAIRDRARLKRLFGFDYRIEIFTPAAKRKYGYYVYPLLEGDRFVGRIEARADRKTGTLRLEKVWLEPKVQWTPARRTKLEAELARMARFVGTPSLDIPGDPRAA